MHAGFSPPPPAPKIVSFQKPMHVQRNGLQAPEMSGYRLFSVRVTLHTLFTAHACTSRSRALIGPRACANARVRHTASICCAHACMQAWKVHHAGCCEIPANSTATTTADSANAVFYRSMGHGMAWRGTTLESD